MKLITIGVLGIVGVFARYYCGILAARFLPLNFPYGTFLINLSGAFFIGVVWVLGIERQFLSETLTQALIVGLLGGFTTFSSYCLDFVRLMDSSRVLSGFFYLVLSPILGVLATYAGMLMARR